MALKTLVKLGEVNNLSDARYGAGMGVDYIGFNLDEGHDKFVDVNTYTAITGWLEGVQYIGEFENSSAADIFEKHKTYQFHAVQISKVEQLAQLSPLSVPKVLKLEISSLEEVVIDTIKGANYLILESSTIEELNSEVIEKLKEISTQIPTFLGFGVTADNVNEVIEQIPIKGITLKGGEEIRPGYKDYDELADILEVLDLDEF